MPMSMLTHVADTSVGTDLINLEDADIGGRRSRFPSRLATWDVGAAGPVRYNR
jgi:hypothetical protein